MSMRWNLPIGALVLSVICLQAGAANPSDPPSPPTRIVSLKDFTDTEIKGAGFTLTSTTRLHISALGGGDKVFWRDVFNDPDVSRMYAAGWIIDAATREVVWEMTMDNTSGKVHRRSFEGTIELEAGDYEVYYAAHGYFESGTFSHSSINIDRRSAHRSHRSGFRFFDFFSNDRGDLYDEFMDNAREYGIEISVDESAGGAVRTFHAPREFPNTVFDATGLGDKVFLRRGLKVLAPTVVRIYALGEGRRRDEIFDYGWIVNSATRERVWDMNDRNVRHAGGASKNIVWRGEVVLSKGTYELYYVTDDSHSSDDWNAKPPYDPFKYGITLTVERPSDRNNIVQTDSWEPPSHTIVSLTRVRDDEFVSAGFTLAKDTRVRVYAIGERSGRRAFADYGWIVRAGDRSRVWSMEDRESHHAGGATKNQMVDEIITLPAGSYIAYYQTDDSHSYGDWNSDPPFDEEAYGLSISAVGEGFDPKTVKKFEEGEEEGVIAQIIRVRDDNHVRKRFRIEGPTKVQIYAVGEGVDRRMADYGWIENVSTGKVVWEMTYGMTDRAGGARKNRMVRTTLILDPGEYELHYRTDDSHSYNDWNDDPPDDRMHWGITVYKSN
ncbi:MAG: hypothetical protein HRF44_04830 [Ignavibacterium sp.]